MLSTIRFTFLFLALTIIAIPGAHATVTNVLPAGVLVTPGSFDAVRNSDDASGDVGSQNPAHIETVLESASWFNQPLTFVGGGRCGTSPDYENHCTAFENVTDGKSGISNLVGDVFAVHYGNNFLAVLYSDLVAGFEINGLKNGVSNIFAFNTVSQVPLPAALPLFLTALAMLGLGGWVRRKRATG